MPVLEHISVLEHMPILYNTRIYGHLRWPPPVAIFLALRVWEGTGAIQDDTFFKNGNNWEGMTILGRNDTILEGMTIIWKE